MAAASIAPEATMADVHLDGNVHLGDLGPELQQHLDRYFDLPGVKYTARGFRNFQNFTTAIYFHCGGLDLAPSAT